MIAVALLVLSYSLILQPRYDVPEGIYDVQNGQCWEIKQKNAYLYEKAGKYYLHSGNENFQLDSEAVDLMEKSGFEFQKGEK